MILKTTVPLWLTVGITCSPSVPLCNAQYIFKMLAMVNQIFMTQVQHSLWKLLSILQSVAYKYMYIYTYMCIYISYRQLVIYSDYILQSPKASKS